MRKSEPPVDVLMLDQFLRMPEVRPPLEFVGGRVVQKVSPKFWHSRLQGRLYKRLDAFCEANGLGEIFTELRCNFGGASLVPDLCLIGPDRIALDPQGLLPDSEFPGAPDLHVEILSPGQTIRTQVPKLVRATRHGVRLAWLIQPHRFRAWAFRPAEPPTILHADQGDALDGLDVLPGFRFPLVELFDMTGR